MHVTRVSSTDQLRNLTSQWNCLSRGIPFRSWEWLVTWWQHFQTPARELYLLAVSDQSGTLTGLAPWYLEKTRNQGRVIRFLGSGAVCTDYLSLLSTREHQQGVTAAIAEWLRDANCKPGASTLSDHCWDLLELDGTAESDPATAQLVCELSQFGCTAHRRVGVNCWQLDLPGSWAEFVAQFSKSRRRKIRRLEQTIQDHHIEWRLAETAGERAQALQILIRLHQARRDALGDPGCFADPTFTEFFAATVERLGINESMQLAWIEVSGQPVAADAFLSNERTVYLYQSGIDPNRLDLEPGHLSSLLMIRRAIEASQQVVDFLRGDEPYKAAWGAQPVRMQQVRIAANRVAPRMRHNLWLAGYTMKNWVKSSMNLAGIS